jgi:antitoxin component YwqK of YwqJK toxin-antitoxin module
MRTYTFILTILVFVGQFAIGQESIERIIHQPESLYESNYFTIYKSDTFNLRDNNGKIQGKGILFLKDSTVIRGSISNSLGYFNDSKIATCVYHENPTNVYYKVKNVFYGQFQDNLPTGVWTCYNSNGYRRVELTYYNGVIQGVVNIYYNSGELMYSGIAIAGQDKIELKKYTKAGLQPESFNWFLTEITELYY